MKNSMISIYMRQVEKYPVLTPQEERMLLIKAAKGDKSAREKIINSNLKFVVKLANSYKNRGVEIEDLICEGNMALLKAIEKMDLSKNVRFITYASFWIRQYMKAAIYSTGRSVSIPQNRPDELIKSKWNAASLEKSLSSDEDSGALVDILEDERVLTAEEEYLITAFDEDLGVALNKLSEIEKLVISKHYGLDNEEPMSLREVGIFLNLSKEGIRLIEKKAIAKLQKIERLSVYACAA